MLIYPDTATSYSWYYGGNALTVDSSQNVHVPNGVLYVGDSANANMTVGLTINQGANTNEIAAFKSSAGTGHGMTDLAEADTFGRVMRQHNTAFGLRIDGFGDGNGGVALNLIGNQDGTADTSHTSGTLAVVTARGATGNGATNGVTTIANEGALFGVSNNGTLRVLVQGEGEMHITNTTLVALDDDDDVQLVRGLQKLSASSGIVETEWDNPLYDYEYLKSKGLAGDIAPGHDGSWLFPVQRTIHAHAGAIFQNYTRHMSLAEKVDGLEVELIEAKKQLAAISA
jgi:hypothetical protein